MEFKLANSSDNLTKGRAKHIRRDNLHNKQSSQLSSPSHIVYPRNLSEEIVRRKH